MHLWLDRVRQFRGDWRIGVALFIPRLTNGSARGPATGVLGPCEVDAGRVRAALVAVPLHVGERGGAREGHPRVERLAAPPTTRSARRNDATCAFLGPFVFWIDVLRGRGAVGAARGGGDPAPGHAGAHPMALSNERPRYESLPTRHAGEGWVGWARGPPRSTMCASQSSRHGGSLPVRPIASGVVVRRVARSPLQHRPPDGHAHGPLRGLDGLLAVRQPNLQRA